MTGWTRIFYFQFFAVWLFIVYVMNDTIVQLDKINADLQTAINRIQKGQP